MPTEEGYSVAAKMTNNFYEIQMHPLCAGGVNQLQDVERPFHKL